MGTHLDFVALLPSREPHLCASQAENAGSIPVTRSLTSSQVTVRIGVN
jgi:hypothetical protein